MSRRSWYLLFGFVTLVARLVLLLNGDIPTATATWVDDDRPPIIVR